jgi:hypothetical protein
MSKSLVAVFAFLAFLTLGGETLAKGHDLEGVNVFRACFETSKSDMVGAPKLNLKLLVANMPSKKAVGSATVTWGSVRDFKTINTTIDGPWYYMCTMDSCSLRYDFSGDGLQGILVSESWGAPGTFIYHFKGGPGEVKQKASVCN